MNETDNDLMIRIGTLIGQLEERGNRFDSLEESIAALTLALADISKRLEQRLSDHEKLETPKIEALQRWMWISVAGLTAMSGAQVLGLDAIKQIVAVSVGR